MKWWRKREPGAPILLQLGKVLPPDFFEMLAAYDGAACPSVPLLSSTTTTPSANQVEETEKRQDSAEEKVLNA